MIAHFFPFRVQSKPYFCRRLPQGWKFSPVTAQKSSEVLAWDPVSPGFSRSCVWIDDFFFGSHTEDELQVRKERFLERCDRANAKIGSMTEISTEIKFVGMDFDLERKRWRVKPDWCEKAKCRLDRFSSPCTLKDIWSVLGLLLWFLRCTGRPLALLDQLINLAARFAPLVLSEELNWNHLVSPWPSAMNVVREVSALVSVNLWRTTVVPLPFVVPDLVVFSDASLYGGAAVFCSCVVWSKKWDFETTSADIFYLESLAWAAGIKAAHAKGARCLITAVDNEGLYYAMLKTRAKEFRVSKIIGDMLVWAEMHHVLLYAAWIPTDRMPADAPSRGNSLTLCNVPVDELRISRWPYSFACLCC